MAIIQTTSRHFRDKQKDFFDLVTFEGTSVDELEKAFREIVTLLIEDCQREGKPLEKSYKGSFNIRISQELL